MPIKFDKPSSLELSENLEISKEALTICKVHYQHSGNTLFIHVPNVFPDYYNIKPKQEVYFLDWNNKIYMGLKEPKIKSYITRRIQWYGNGKGIKYIRIPIPVQLRKKYKLDLARAVHLVKEDDQYECIFI